MGIFGKSKFEKGNDAFIKGDFNLAKKFWEEGAYKGDSDSCIALGSMYEKGKGVNPDPALAFSLYEKALSKDTKLAPYYAGRALLYGIGTTQDVAKGLELLKKAALRGVRVAKDEVTKYENARRANPNHVPTTAASDSNSDAAYAKALALCKGDGCPQDIEQAMHWLRIAADQNNPKAMKELADCYLNGVGIDQDETKAFELYKKAAELGYADAQFVFAGFFLNGRLVEKNYSEGARWIKKASDQGHPDAQMILGNMFHLGEGVPKNQKEAFAYFSKAAAQQVPRAELMIGHFYYYGVGTERNYDQAFTNLLFAFDHGEKSASLLLGLYFLNHGHNNTRDYKKAYYYLSEAAKLDMPEAKSHLALCYSKGLGVKRDQSRAFDLFTEVFKNESTPREERAAAACNMGVILLANNEVKRDVAAAKESLENAITLGSSLALYCLGMLYYDGAKQDGRSVISRDNDKAYHFLRAAAEKGVDDARKYLTSDLSALIPRSSLKVQGLVGEFLEELSSGIVDAIADNI